MIKPTISMVFPFYNEESVIGSCLEKILDQSEIPEEVLLVDNNSKDNARKIAEAFAPRFEKKGIEYHIINEKEKGQVKARILGFDRAKGQIIGMIDADSLLTRHWVKTAKRFLLKKNVVGLCGPTYYYNASFWRKLKLFKDFFLSFLFQSTSLLWGCNAVFSKKAYLAVNGLNDYHRFHEKLGLKYIYDDNYLTWKLRKVGKIRFSWGLRIQARDRCDINRIKDHHEKFFLIRNYIRNQPNQ